MSRERIIEDLIERSELNTSGRQVEFDKGKRITDKLVSEYEEYKELLAEQGVGMYIINHSTSQTDDLDLNLKVGIEGLNEGVSYFNTSKSFKYDLRFNRTLYDVPFEECTDEHIVLKGVRTGEVKKQTYREHVDYVIKNLN